MLRRGTAAAAGLAALTGPATGVSEAALPLAPTQLVVRVRELPGLSPGKSHLTATSSASKWAHEGFGTRTELRDEAALLEREGFSEGARERLEAKRPEGAGRHREALSEVAVVATPAGASAELGISLHEGERSKAGPGFVRFAVPHPAGAFGIGSFTGNGHGADANVFFTVGRCFFAVGVHAWHGPPAATLERIPIAGAVALAHRAAKSCS